MSTSNLRANRRLAHRTELPMALGCTTCPELEYCGGLNTDEPLFDCDALCRCTAEERLTCTVVCRSKSAQYARYRREVGGFKLDTVGHAPRTAAAPLPATIPWVDSRGGLAGGMELPVVAVPLRRLFSGKTGMPLVRDREQLAARFAVTPSSRFVVSGVDFDQPIEHYWELARSDVFLDTLSALKPALLTTPNFSLFSDLPREGDLYNMKRIALCWQETASRGIPTALHLNARTDFDWFRWCEFLNGRDEIEWVAFEFGTGAASNARALWHLNHLFGLAAKIRRPLRLVVRGGLRHLTGLRSAFASVAFVATTPLMKTRKRRRLVLKDGEPPRWLRVAYHAGERLDHLFLDNVESYSKLVGG